MLTASRMESVNDRALTIAGSNAHTAAETTVILPMVLIVDFQEHEPHRT